MKNQFTAFACALLLAACGEADKPQSNQAPISIDESQLSSEYQNLPQGMIVRVPVDASGNMEVNSAEVRNYMGSALTENDVQGLQAAFEAAQINQVYGNGLYNPSLASGINYINYGANTKGKGAYQGPGQLPSQVPGKGLPTAYDKSGKGTPGQFPGQYPGQAPGKVGQAPGQFPGQYPGQAPGKVGQAPGQFPGQYPGQAPGKVGQAPGQFPGQYPGQAPGQFPGQAPGKGKYGFGLSDSWNADITPTTVAEIDRNQYRYNRNDMQDNFFHSRFRPAYRSGIYSNLYWSYYMNPYLYYSGSNCYFYYQRPSCGGYNWCGNNYYY